MADPRRLAADPVTAGAAGASAPSAASGPPVDEREAALRPVECDRCGAAVLVAKFSLQHTSVQWSMDSMRTCAEFSARIAAGRATRAGMARRRAASATPWA